MTLLSLDTFRLRKVKKLTAKINALAPKMAQLSNEQLQQLTPTFKKRLKEGETLEDLLPEAFAAMREANKRILGLYPYDVQVMGGIVLHFGNIAEMKTGEGKTLTATLPLYLNALTGKGAMLITPNDYLATRDAQEMRPVFNFMGLSVGYDSLPDDEKQHLEPEVVTKMKKALYHSDILYLTNSQLGFDYLSDNLQLHANQRYMRDFHYAIVDEVDAVLLDAAQTPLIISGAAKVQSNLYEMANQFIQTLTLHEEYALDEEKKNVWLTPLGIQRAQAYFGIDDLYNLRYLALNRSIILALRAHTLFHPDQHYAVYQGKVMLLDRKSGRLMPGVKLHGGQHQAIEAKEHVSYSPDTKTIASITYQNLFRLFPKLAGMSGTVKVDEDEMIDTYGMMVIQIPTNKPIIRQDLPDMIYRSLPEKLIASIEKVKEIHATGQPILLITGSVDVSELYSKLLLQEGISHNVLNAHNAAKEAQIIKESGQLNAVTIATPMAGRGTDIKLGEGVAQLGGLAVIGVERMQNKRIDLQLRGRAGRQGDPGLSQFYLSLDDELILNWGSQSLQRLQVSKTFPEKSPKPLHSKRIKRLIEEAQNASDSAGRQARHQAFQFDESAQYQRNLVYQKRHELLNHIGEMLDIVNLLSEVIDDVLTEHDCRNHVKIERFVLDYLSYSFSNFERLFASRSKASMKQQLMNIVLEELERKKAQFATEEGYRLFEQLALLKAIDECWVEQIDTLELLKGAVRGRQFAQRNPLFQYQQEALQAYEWTQQEIKKNFIRHLSLSYLTVNDKNEIDIHFM